jgi:hypothetical protein
VVADIEPAPPVPDQPAPSAVNASNPEPSPADVADARGYSGINGRPFKFEKEASALPAVAQEKRDAYSGSIAEVGDLVVVRYNDQPEKPLRVRLSKTENRPNDGIVLISEPLGEALLGAAAEDEVEVDIGGMIRIVFVEKVEKAEAGRLRRHSGAEQAADFGAMNVRSRKRPSHNSALDLTGGNGGLRKS